MSACVALERPLRRRRVVVSRGWQAFSIETVVAYSAKSEVSKSVADGLDSRTKLFAPLTA
jgi:hypothetical protein